MSEDPEFEFAPHVTAVVEEHGEIFQEALTPACDFCLDARVKWEYPCEDFVIEEIGFGSQGGWLACERCAELIEGRFLADLTARSTRSWLKRHETIYGEQIDSMARIQQGFFDHRRGDRFSYDS